MDASYMLKYLTVNVDKNLDLSKFKLSGNDDIISFVNAYRSLRKEVGSPQDVDVQSLKKELNRFRLEAKKQRDEIQ